MAQVKPLNADVHILESNVHLPETKPQSTYPVPFIPTFSCALYRFHVGCPHIGLSRNIGAEGLWVKRRRPEEAVPGRFFRFGCNWEMVT